ncbi:hypothetical protein Pmar_PMAR027397 [Perkinsus marinus ATCC 50983]|uniref:C3H1-type domain-containing protein n=1 Tax=Perkinsus marinus (strain ATCC 50983 / TXsc) TaxID=423536 RepID=C5KSG5_PERM5|nr:hypothetical protein Pmar_PMAR027397 [Perkinsus marinus ATCC 50983]EER12579.1 hypothetical protein Pmar_PMAR027397 [Perkinsus marinus ATCC 50983]|eukprot:XP_002780784.1 hypothetical protein Pmar_PMAR027397 [Perkinsus marinus ATCC 50983]
MASSSAVGKAQIPTSGSDAGTLPHLVDAITFTAGSPHPLFDDSTASDDAANIILAVIEGALTTNILPDLQTCADALSLALVERQLGTLSDEEKDNITGVVGDRFVEYVARRIEHACTSAAEGVLQQDDIEHLSRNLSDMVVTRALHAQPLVDRISSQHLLPDHRRRNLAALRELQSVRSSVFSPGWRDWFLQVTPSSSPPSRRTGTSEGLAHARLSPIQVDRVSAAPVISSHPSVHSSAVKTTVQRVGTESVVPSAGSTETVTVDESRRRLAHKDADKAAKAFKGGPYSGIDDPRGLSGFWRQLESFVVRRGWRLGGPEQYFLLTSLVPEDEARDVLDEEAPLTLLGYAQAVDRIHQTLLEDSGGTLESEKLLSETVVRSPSESLTSFIAKIDRWARRCKSAGVALSDGHIIKAYRIGINDSSCRDASYEYPSSWREFRIKAMTRAARVDSEQKKSGEPGSSGRPDQAKSAARDKGGQQRLPVAQGGQRPPTSPGICRQHLRGACSYGDRCKFSHVSGPREECRQWLNGNCRFGDRCVHAHNKKRSDNANGKKATALKTVQEGPSEEKEIGERAAEEEQVQMLWAMPDLMPSAGGDRQQYAGPTMLFEIAGGQRPLQALLDSGAVRNYISQAVVEARGWKCFPSEALARLADGSTLRVRGSVRVIVVYDGMEVPLDFHILPPRANSVAADDALDDRCILGTRSMCTLGISLRFSEEGGKRRVVISRPITHQRSTVDHPRPSASQSIVADYGTVNVIDEVLTVRFHRDDSSLCHVAETSDLFPSMAVEPDCGQPPEPVGKHRPFDDSWCAVRGAPQYAVRLRPIGGDEEKDCPDQTHVAEVRWQVTTAPPGSKLLRSPADFSIPLYNRLSEEQKRTFRQEIAKFTVRGWWSEISPSDAELSTTREEEEQLPVAIAFPVPQGEAKVRPCVDVRQCNRQSPNSSYVGASCPVILSQIRVALAQIAAKARTHPLLPLLSLETMDCMTAFYRIRLHRKCARIRCLGRVYTARRLIFGLRCGPAVLEEVLHRLVQAARQNLSSEVVGSLPLYHYVYVDDLTLLGDRQAVTAFKNELIRVGAAWGFEFSAAKMHSIHFDAEGHCNPFDDFTHLGVRFAGQPTTTNSCELRLRCAHIPLPEVQTLVAGSKLSKRCAFKIAGAAFDVLSVHGEQSLAGDLVRRVSGRWKTSSWDESVVLAKDEATALNIAMKVLSDKPAVCDHAVCFHAEYVDIYADASPTGLGIVALFSRRDEQRREDSQSSGHASQDTVLYRRAKMWKNAQYNWHQNRKEAFALAGAYLFLNSVVAYVSPLTVRFWSDSHTAISWVTGGSKLTCESIERVAISRLIDAMADLRESWHRRYGLVPVTYHLAGKKNSSADELSRLSALWKIVAALGDIYEKMSDNLGAKLSATKTLVAGSKLSKRCAFKIAGAAFDVLSVHGEQSLAGDLVRRVSGRWKTSSWDESVVLAKDEATALNIAMKVLSDKPAVCDHAVCFHAEYVDIYADASPTGLGIVALFSRRDEQRREDSQSSGHASQDTVLYRRAKMWKNAQYNWHQNRKEAFALAGAYLFLNSVVAYVSPLTVRFWSDSHTAISWVTGGSKLTCESIERVAISRLIDAMADLRESWHRRYGLVPVTYHLAGSRCKSVVSERKQLWIVPGSLKYCVT